MPIISVNTNPKHKMTNNIIITCIKLFNLLPTTPIYQQLIAADYIQEQQNSEITSNAFREGIYTLDITENFDSGNEFSNGQVQGQGNEDGKGNGNGHGSGYSNGDADGYGNDSVRNNKTQTGKWNKILKWLWNW